ncbi:MAG: tetratricopeptide repeat protein [Planctomycetota bacterium]
MTQRRDILIAVLAAAAVLAGPAAAGEGPLPPPRQSEGDRLDALLNELSALDSEQLLEEGLQRRIELEQQMVVAEIRFSGIDDPADAARAIDGLHAAPARSNEQNIERLCDAFAVVRPRFGQALELYRLQEFDQAADRVEGVLNPHASNYFSAASYGLYADACVAAGRPAQGLLAYGHVLERMPDRYTFAATTALQAARTYEKLGYHACAIRLYDYALRQYGLCLTPTETAEALAALKRLRARLGEDAPQPEAPVAPSSQLSWAPGETGQDDGRTEAADEVQDVVRSLRAGPADPLAEEHDWNALPPARRQQMLRLAEELLNDRSRAAAADYRVRVLATPAETEQSKRTSPPGRPGRTDTEVSP